MRGFTLIELLAVIVILSIILLISIPLINNVIEGVKESAFKDTGYGILKSAEFTYANDILAGVSEEVTFTFNEGLFASTVPGKKLEFNGTMPKNGAITINKSGQIAMTLSDGKYCIEKKYTDTKITISEKPVDECVTAKGEPGNYALKQPIITVSNSTVTTEPVTVSIGFQNLSSAVKHYKIGSGEWFVYSGPFEISNNSIVYAKIERDGEIAQSELKIRNIIPLGWIAISNADELYAVRDNLAGKYIMVNDVDLSTSAYSEWTPIVGFAGQFDGNDSTIKGLKTNLSTANVGLFGTVIGADVEIKNLSFTDVNIKGGSTTGTIVGSVTGSNFKITNVSVSGTVNGTDKVGGIIGSGISTISNTTVTGLVKGTTTSTGGFVGFTSGISTITNASKYGNTEGATYVGGFIGQGATNNIDSCSNYGAVIATSNAGGLIGYGTASSIISSKNEGNITANGAMVGGFIGKSVSTITITNSYSTGAIIAQGGYTGGLIGESATITITGSYTSGSVKGIGLYVGGLVGYSSITSNISMSYATGNIEGTCYVGGLVGRTSNGTIDKTFASGNVHGTGPSSLYAYVGGLVGLNASTISNSYALGDVSSLNSKTSVGGLVGETTKSLTNNYSIGKVTSPVGFGPVIGISTGGTHTNNYWIGDTSKIYSGTFGTLINTTQMGTLSSNYAGFDFTGIWDVIEGETTPFLRGMMIDNKNYIINIQSYFHEGEGTQASPYLIKTAEDFYQMRVSLDAYYKVMNDINLATSAYSEWTPIANFSGTLDGNNHTINGLKVSGTGSQVGLFATVVLGEVEIKNITFTNVNISGSTQVGGLIGNTATDVRLVNVDMSGTVNGTGDFVGGMIGKTTGALNVTGSDNIMNVTGKTSVGGIVGDTTQSGTYSTITSIGTINGTDKVGGIIGSGISTISNTTVTGLVKGTASYTGGFVGFTSGISTITNASKYGNTEGATYVGGFIGQGTTNNIDSCNNYGAVIATSYVGGLIGNGTASTIISSKNEGNITANGGTVGGFIGKSVNNVTITNSYSTGNIVSLQTYAGGLIGESATITITGSYTSGSVTSSSHYVGGLVGFSSITANISMSYATGNIEGTYYVGGLVGRTSNGTIDKTFASGNVLGKTSGVTGIYVGGLVGENASTITNSYALGDITSLANRTDVGGLVGRTAKSLTNNYSIGKVTSLGAAGAIIGISTAGTHTNNYWIEQSSGIATSTYGTKITTNVLARTGASYIGFDFVNNWEIIEGSTSPYIKGLVIDPKNYILP